MIEHLQAILGLGASVAGLTKSAVETGQAVKDLVSQPDVDAGATQKLVSDLLDRLIRLQTEQLTMQQELLGLQKAEKQRSRFEAQRHRYALTKTELGSLVYALKPTEAGDEPPHCLCASCFDDEVKSILQPVGHNTFECRHCRVTIYMPDGKGSGIMMVPTKRSSMFDF